MGRGRGRGRGGGGFDVSELTRQIDEATQAVQSFGKALSGTGGSGSGGSAGGSGAAGLGALVGGPVAGAVGLAASAVGGTAQVQGAIGGAASLASNLGFSAAEAATPPGISALITKLDEFLSKIAGISTAQQHVQSTARALGEAGISADEDTYKQLSRSELARQDDANAEVQKANKAFTSVGGEAAVDAAVETASIQRRMMRLGFPF